MKRSSSPQDHDILKILKDMESQQTEYPPQLLSARRAAFMDQVAQHNQVEIEEVWSSKDQEVIDLLKRLKSVEEKYPLNLWASRRSAFVRRVAWLNWINLWNTLYAAIQRSLANPAKVSRSSTVSLLHASLVVVSLAVAAFVGFISYGNRVQSFGASSSPAGITGSGRILTTNSRVVSITCKPGYQPPLCLTGEFEKSQDLTFQGNGSARPAVAKDTMPGYRGIHRAAHINDGLYGPGASWISNSPDSWIKIDLGKATPINTVAFGRDRLGKFNDRSPGRFVISVALSDNVYADGNSSNDELEYKQVYDSDQAGFNGTISGAETVMAQFDPLVARYIKITFENEGTAIDEVEVFMVQRPVVSSKPGRTPEDTLTGNTATSMPTGTPLPSNTPTSVPTSTPLPTDTATPTPTSTPLPTDTATPTPTNTPLPTDTRTSVPSNTPLPTNTALPTPTSTPLPTDWPPGLWTKLTLIPFDP
jgi:hypothetical protein